MRVAEKEYPPFLMVRIFVFLHLYLSRTHRALPGEVQAVASTRYQVLNSEFPFRPIMASIPPGSVN